MALSFTWSLASEPLVVSSSETPDGADAAGATAWRDLAVDLDGDIYLDPDTGDIAGVVGLDAVASDLQARLETFLGEYQWDTEIGVPYRQEILGEKPTRARLEEIFRAQCIGCPGIAEVVELTVGSAARELSITMRLRADLGGMIAATLIVTQQQEN